MTISTPTPTYTFIPINPTITISPIVQPPSVTYAGLTAPGAISVWWSNSSTTSVSAYRVLRSTAGGPSTQVAEIPSSDGFSCATSYPHCFIDYPPTGQSCYQVVAVNNDGKISLPGPTKCANRP